MSEVSSEKPGDIWCNSLVSKLCVQTKSVIRNETESGDPQDLQDDICRRGSNVSKSIAASCKQIGRKACYECYTAVANFYKANIGKASYVDYDCESKCNEENEF
ncbi:unnamed protein product [Bursaphelenchus okinawaensis]|uniref:Uncharacterized protein n=1 Tax=Bursaphelenchus okinawaensis TaxID=465554 RepID=A0A811KRB0_9BILA|nr:unnamed protein product [Bursaphelenchus okinawaensis]CAG9109544.1 unnamed protein product [Bursaphelenchus okinawaensis]